MKKVELKRRTLSFGKLHAAVIAFTLGLLANAPVFAADSVLSNPMMPTDELTLLLEPLTQEQLLKAADDMQVFVQAKATEIAAADLQVLRDNKKIATEQAKEPSPDSSGDATKLAAESVIEKAVEEIDTEKAALLEQQTRLREERTLLIDNMKAILDELVTKTDNDDKDTQSIILNHRLYLRAVSGIHVDVSDTTSTWVTVKGWVLSKQGGLRWAANLSKFLGFLVFVWLLARLLGYLARLGTRRTNLSLLQADFVARGITWVTLIIGFVWSMTVLQLSMAPILTMLGAAGLVVALAMQDSLSNVASGLMILFFRPFDMNDVVEAGGVSGKIESLNLVSTTIKTFDNKIMVVPNSRIWSDVITNATDVTQRRVDLEFGIGYDDDMDQAAAILEEIVTSHPKVLKDPAPTIKLMSLGDSSINFICRPWTAPADYWDVYWDVTRQVKLRFDEADIGIPFPQRDVNLYVKTPAPKPRKSGSTAVDSLISSDADEPHPDGGLDR